MEEPFLAEIRVIPARIAPEGWARCDGRKMRIAEHPALFKLLGNTFGGDGQATFALPNLVGCKPVPIELHSLNLALVNSASRPLGLEKNIQPTSGQQMYGSTCFCIALKGRLPVG
ncbi:phage tail protein [Dyadobacter luticola]|uniref:Phage tail collar domain-containing protein n=1 Tax=Dyadobacter luticola TaxID=1979387 RepID=A0A5R9KW59_9BACT|nr:tail fiber protein [Dyadobacter luticola]TLV00380.1 hypothetical protein FEN17_12875 [Dyadobacter luticola]